MYGPNYVPLISEPNKTFNIILQCDMKYIKNVKRIY